MHFSLVSLAILVSCSATYSHPGAERNELNLKRSRPIQQFFKNILNALRPTTTPEPPTSTTRRTSKPSSFHSNVEFEEIPNFVDFSTYLLGSFASNNTAIKFTYMQPNETAVTKLRGNYSVISFLVPHESDAKQKGIFSFLNSLRLPWNRVPTNTEISKFPPILEYFTQRIQTYFSVYKYDDDSRVNNTIVFFVPDGLTANSEDVENNAEMETPTDYQMETTSNLQVDAVSDIANEME